MEKIAFFDVDGTLVKGFYIIDFPNYLHQKNIFDGNQLEIINRNFSLFKKGQLSYYHLGKIVGEAYAKGISGIKKNEVEYAGKMFIQDNPERIYPFSEKLIELIRNKSYQPVIISGSPYEIIYHFAQEFEIDEVFATTCEIMNDKFTGNLVNNLILGEVKQKIIKLYIQNNSVDLKLCAGFGDTEQDISFLGLVGYPVAIKPNEELKKISKEKNFCICQDDNQIIECVNIFLK